MVLTLLPLVAIPLGAALICVWTIRRTFTVVTVHGASMRPTLCDGDRILVRRRPRNGMRPGQIVVLAVPALAMSTEPVVVIEEPWPRAEGSDPLADFVDAQTGLRNGEPFDPMDGDLAGSTELIVKRVLAIPGDPVPRDLLAFRGVTHDEVPSGRFVVVGDNPAESMDSRHTGYFDLDDLHGVFVRRL